MSLHLVFYDGSCGLCDHAVQFILKHDKKKEFDFSHLQGKTADTLLGKIPRGDTLILIENYKTPQRCAYLYGAGALRILWLLGGVFTLLGFLNFLPPCLYNWAYRLVAKNRHRFFPNPTCAIPDPEQKKRFLP